MKKWLRKHRVDIFVIAICLAIAIPLGYHWNSAAISISLLAWPVAFLTARHYGDVAAGTAAREHARRQAREARFLALNSLLLEIGTIRDFAEHNANVASRRQALIRMPVSAIEYAVLSRESVVWFPFKEREMTSPTWMAFMTQVKRYLKTAHAINALIETRLVCVSAEGHIGSAMREEIEQEIAERSSALLPLLDEMASFLLVEAEKAGQSVEGMFLSR